MFFIDGFNLYHSLDDNPKLHKYKWLNIKSLTEAFIPRNSTVKDIYYFTAYPDWNPNKVKRHKNLVEIYQDLGVQVIFGVFRKKHKTCRKCYRKSIVPEEKRTDVNIAIMLLDLAYKNGFDSAYIVSGDSDLIPAVELIKANFPRKSCKVIIPFGRKAKELIKACGGSRSKIKIKEDHLSRNVLPNPYITHSGRSIGRPPNWV